MSAILRWCCYQPKHRQGQALILSFLPHYLKNNQHVLSSPVSFQLAHLGSKIQLVRAETSVSTLSPQWVSLLSEGAPDSVYFFFIKLEGLPVWKVVLKQKNHVNFIFKTWEKSEDTPDRWISSFLTAWILE